MRLSCAGEGRFISECECCQPSSLMSVPVRVLCSDGHSATVSIIVPSTCQCLQCGDTHHLQQAVDLKHQVAGQARDQDQAQVVGDVKTDNMDVNFAPRKGQVSISDIFGDGDE